MANTTRILFISGEVVPFTPPSQTGQIVRTLPEQVHESGRFETRIMMPRYGTISERRNRLHEVIRLSGSEIDIAGEPHTLKVKVASIPGIRLQVYFMDNVHFFKRKGITAGKDGVTFKDNAERSLYFGRAVLETIKNLGWQPAVVHAFGWASGLVPLLLKSDFADDELLSGARIVFTPDNVDPKANFGKRRCSNLGLPEDIIGEDLNSIGKAYADAVIYPPNPAENGQGPQFGEDAESQFQIAAETYEQLVGVPA